MKKIKNILGVFLVAIAFGLCIPNNVIAEEVNTEEVNTEEVMSEKFKSYLNEDGKYEITASKPKDILDFLIKLVLYCYETNLDFEKVTFDLEGELPESFDKIVLVTYYKTETEARHEEKHEVEIEWVYDEKVEAKINEITSNTKKEVFNLSDLETIDFYYNRYKMPLNYYADIPMLTLVSSEAKSVLNNNNINFKMLIQEVAEETEEEIEEETEEEVEKQEQDGLKTQIFEALAYYTYNNSIYYTYIDLETQFIFANLNLNHIFYVPSDTPNNVDAIKEAAQKRINEYLKNNQVTLSYVSTASDYLLNNSTITTYEDFSETFNAEYKLDGINENDLVYHVEMNINEKLTNSFDMIIRRDSSKMVVPTLKTVDLLTGIEVNANSILPLDTSIIVNQLDNGTEYEKIMKLLGLTDSVTYDIKLYSKTLENYITKLEDGTFEVKIPIPENLKGKDLTVYYVNEDGKVEGYEVTIKDGYAIFNTNHFSIYTLGDTKDISTMNEKNPETGDNILLYIVTSIMSLICLAGISTHIYKKTSKEVR